MTVTSRTAHGGVRRSRTEGRAARPLPPRLLASDLFLLAMLAHDGRRRLAPALARLALGPREFAVLSVLDDAGASSQQAIVETLGIDASEIVAAVDLLEARALARRERDAADRRRYAVTLTARGRRVLRHAEALAGRAADEVLAALGARDRAALH
ncbi:MAG: MarR family transcriptional regulator, partial [Chloroflexota bacterium]|nr:MarR family transcriptional regulator [Chloroflexota bacterium]